MEQELASHLPEEEIPALEWLDILHLRHLLKKPLIQLSNGENKRVQLVIALLSKPDLLILDNPFTGLDSEGRETIRRIIQTLPEKGVAILLITSIQEIPDIITHVVYLEKGKIRFADKRENFQPGQFEKRLPAFDISRLKHFKLAQTDDFEFAVKMTDIHVRYGENRIIENLDWEVRRGECWSVSGPNGAGKSTLLSLITADNPQAYANDIYLFDRKRGTSESIWDIKKKIGFVSPELHLYFDYNATCFEVIASGLFDTIGLFRKLGKEQEEKVLLWLELLELEQIRSKDLMQLSVGQQRMTLLARALIKNPPLLILDEPCQGLDDEQALYFKELVDHLCTFFTTTLIYVSHYKGQIPSCVNRFLELGKLP
jgi:molybdate transport system ATP-binding protein